MKLLQVALAGLAGLVGLAACAGVPPTANWVNDASGKYVCKGLTIECCAYNNSACSWVETCAKGCFDTGNGALCVDRVSVEKKSEADASAAASCETLPALRYWVYKCNGATALKCMEQNDHCLESKDCLGGCTELGSGNVKCCDNSTLSARDEPKDKLTSRGECRNFRYQCQAYTVEECEDKTNACYFKALCQGQCTEDESGSVKCCDKSALRTRREAEVVAPNSARNSPEDGPIAPTSCVQRNANKTQFWQCRNNDVMRCTDHDGSCSFYETCEGGCTATAVGRGVVCCGKWSSDTKHEAEAATSHNINTRGENTDAFIDDSQGENIGVSGERRKCSSTHRGVLTCIEGFCSVRPGDYCEANESCRDSCGCCKKDSKHNLKLMTRSPPNDERSEQDMTHAWQLCTPGLYWCHPYKINELLVCDAERNWIVSADCGSIDGASYCRGPDRPGTDHHCDCRNNAHDSHLEADINTAHDSLPNAEISPRQVEPDWSDCVPGEIWCNLYDTAYLLTCNAEKRWKVSAFCGRVKGNGCCRGPSNPGSEHHCDCRSTERDLFGSAEDGANTPTTLIKAASSASPALAPDSKVKKAANPITLAKGSAENPSAQVACSTPAEYSCFGQWLILCSPDHVWIYSSDCGTTSTGNGCCRNTMAGGQPSAVCDCRGLPGGPPSLALDVNVVKKAANPVAPAKGSDEDSPGAISCSTPGDYNCQTGFQWLIICSPDHVWVWSADCGTVSTGVGCCKATHVDGQLSAVCDCRGLPGGPPTLEPAVNAEAPAVKTIVTPAIATPDKRSTKDLALRTGHHCDWPGAYWCAEGNEWVYVCSPEHEWKYSAYCGKTSQGVGCCRISTSPDGQQSATCDCRGLPGGPPLLARDAASTPEKRADTAPVLAAGASCLRPGNVECTGGGMAILTCSPQYEWYISVLCGGQGCCRTDGTNAYCACRGRSDTPRALEGGAAPEKRSTDESEITAAECTPGQYSCDQASFNWIIVCTPTGKWLKMSYCGQTSLGYGCCRGSSISGGAPSCDCRNLPGGPTAAKRSIGDEASPEVGSSLQDPIEAPCTPGTYRCSRRDQDKIQVCAQTKKWVLSAVCCGVHTCEFSPTYPVPKCRCGNAARGLESGWNRELDGPQDPDEPGFCTPGRYTCGDRETRVYVCDWNGNWQRSAICKVGMCRRGDKHDAYCM
ncbi:hypothetical protein CC86DRAFT_403278 [Ophiobolus disseminans]|uniref:SRCR domain-containing protein n=1 Tax=Ophiobolus disseminans TaxID=1469910 RepID=A0A6A7A9R4_9PLEO|nr:hypothetical protein CC86DRAFT_403278 [Ophiobolus disseminans]